METEQEMAQAVMNAAKKTLISQVMKRNVIENIVPTVISLKHMVSDNREYNACYYLTQTHGACDRKFSANCYHKHIVSGNREYNACCYLIQTCGD